jgi:uncharacterized protein (DUF2252 family)
MKFQQPSPSSFKERYDRGKQLRKATPRETLGEWAPAKERPDPLRTLATVNPGRIPALLPIKAQRMSASPFAFFRGAAVLMSSDLVTSPVSGLTVQLCGDAHIRNLGAYADPDGRLIFDLNDFDETLPGPWEWDVKRLATSLVLAGDEAGETQANCVAAVRAFVSAYRQALNVFAELPVLDLAKYRVSRHREDPVLAGIFDKAQRVTPLRNLKKLAARAANGAYRFHDEPPLLRHVQADRAQAVLDSLAGYRDTLGAGRRMVFDAYRPADVAFKLVGTGSVGTRDYVVLLFGNGLEDPLFLQVKQELTSCHQPYLPSSPRSDQQGRRVAEGQQRMQTAYDPLLGYTRMGSEDYLVRQLADHKAALDPADLVGKVCSGYAALCGEVLAKGHARTGDAAALAGYCGNAAKLDDAIAKFAVTYAAQTKADYKLFMKSLPKKPGNPKPK